MKYFRKDNIVYAYDAEQLAMGYGKDMAPMTDEEVELHINPPKTEQQLLQEKLQEAQAFLDKTDKKVLPYYDFEEGDNDLQWYVVERAKARAFIRTGGVVEPEVIPEPIVEEVK